MAAARKAQEASSSVSRCTYHVFLSFRGEDTRTNFTDHLYNALVQAGIHTFLDDDGIERGENIVKELEKAIKESKLSIIVFSKDYASSRWCLNELVMIMELRKAVGLIVLPVFYDVDPSHVRNQTGSFGKAFTRLAKQFKAEIDKVTKWREALREVADLGGMVLGNRLESQFVQNIVKEIANKLNRTLLKVDPYLVGLDSRITAINLWVKDGSNDVGIAMIYGIGGIGKTTIAKTVYNMNFDRFEGSSFLENVRDTTKQPNGLVLLQRQLLKDILKGKTSKISNADEGIIKIKNSICCKKILLILDDMDQLDQLNAIIGMREWFHLGSKIIITTRHEFLLGSHQDCEKFKVEQMDDDESLQLFSWHAFRQNHPTEGYMECSKKVVHQCGGLPLALQVLGSSLSGRSTNVWESALQKLEAIPHSEIQNVLKVSYDSLQDDHDQNLFLNIACFFIGKDKDYTVGILNGCGFYTISGIQNLIDRCLLTISPNKKLIMHQLLRDMGREIVRQESTDNPGKRSRLWHHNAFTVLKEKTGTEAIKGLTLDLYKLIKDEHGNTIVNVNNAKRHSDENSRDKSTIGNCLKRRRLSFFSWKPMSTTSENSFPLSNEARLDTKTFVKMNNLKLLQLNYAKFNGDYRDFPKNLIWLCWHGFPLKSIPPDFCLGKLVALDMCYSSLNNVWRKTKFLADLKFLNLSHSHDLVRTPDFSRLPNLERLIFKDCINLVMVDESVADLERLVLLNLKDCKKLKKLPRKISLLKLLEELNLSGCLGLDELPEDLGKMESLKVLYLDGIPTNQLLSTTRDTNRLSLLSPTFWHSTFWSWLSWLSPRKGPYSTSFSMAILPHSLKKLSLTNCNLSYDDISYGLTSLPSLNDLNLSGNPFHSLPESMRGLVRLLFLELECCTRLQSLPKFSDSLCKLNVDKCTSLERVQHHSFMPFFHLLTIKDCENLVEVKGVFKLEPIENTDIAVIKSLGLSNLDSLGSIEVHLNSIVTRMQRKTPLQVLHECGISSIFLPRSKVPRCFVLRNTGSSISFIVPPRVGQKISSLNLCTFYAFVDGCPFPQHPHYAKINNKTKHKRWTYNPMFYATPISKEKGMLWLSNWNLGDQLEGGDEVHISVLLPQGFQVKMCGVRFEYELEDKGILSKTEEIVLDGLPWDHSDFPWYQTCTHFKVGADMNLNKSVLFCCHHSYTSVHHTLGLDGISPESFVSQLVFSVQGDICLICEAQHYTNRTNELD